MLKHYRGNSTKYKYDASAPNDATKSPHKDGIYFATDTKEIYMNGETYGGGNSKALTTADIQISGGPLASEFTDESGTLSELPETWKIKNSSDSVIGYKIPANTSLQDVLNTLFCIEKWSIPNLVEGSLNPSTDRPTIENWPTTLQEVGTTIQIGTSLTKGFNSGKTSTGFDGNFLYGYADTSGNKYAADTKPNNKDLTEVTFKKYDNAEIKITINTTALTDISNVAGTTTNNAGVLTRTITPAEDVQDLIGGFNFKVKEGENKITVKHEVSGVYYTASTQNFPQYYPISRLGNVSSTPTPALYAKTITSQHVEVSDEFTPSFTGVYPIYTNGIVLKATDTNASGAFIASGASGKAKLNLINQTTTMYLGFGKPSDTLPWCIYLPSGFSISSSGGYNPTNVTGWDSPASWTNAGTVNIDVNGNATGVPYTKYTSTGGGAANNVKITIKKS